MIIKTIIEIYSTAEYSPLISPREELHKLFYDLTHRYTIGLSYGLFIVLKRAYEEDRDALRKALIALLKNSNSYFRNQISKYPWLQADYENKISKNETLIEKLEKLW